MGIITRFLLLLCLPAAPDLRAQGTDTLWNESGTVAAPGPDRQKIAKIAGIAIPSLMVAYGAASFFCDGIRQVDYNIDGRLHAYDHIWHSKADNYIQFAPAAAAFTMKLAKVESRNDFLDMTFIYALSGGLTAGIVETTKTLTGRERPDGSSDNSFPSGHTATAFAAAEFLHREFGHHSVWISIGGYTAATLVGASRMFNDKHWLSDVVAGAGIGILCTKTSYWLYPHIKKLICSNGKRPKSVIYPVYYAQGSWGFGLSCAF